MLTGRIELRYCNWKPLMFTAILLASKFWGVKYDCMKLVSILSTENIWQNVSRSEEEAQKRFIDTKVSNKYY